MTTLTKGASKGTTKGASIDMRKVEGLINQKERGEYG